MHNKVVIVTGGGRGIGAATCLLLAKHGYKVCVNYIANKESANKLVAQIENEGGVAIAVQADISNEVDVIELFDIAEKELGSITHLVNNAGILFKQSALVDIEPERFEKIMKINVTGCFLCCREAVKRMKSGGAIVNVSSLAAKSGSPFEYVDYAASKGAMDTLTKGLSAEVAAQGIRVNGVRPGFIYTEMHADGGEPDRVERLSSQIPMQRGGQPEEVAEAIAWLLSDKASYATGTFIDLAGGK
ncbi:MAG: glucose 1-dehydrogenase [Kangiellaceae bacterium]|nr:glucose 1-dehydrogenase [Kangiellaceae bacterium]MCW9000580.1 glucose 1-dehydrogenase [Kangiellaceae bacterium]